MTEYAYRWIAVSIRGELQLPYTDTLPAKGWERVPNDDPMCPELNDRDHRSLVLYRRPIELAIAAAEQARNTAQQNLLVGTEFVVSGYKSDIDGNPVYNTDDRDTVLAQLEDFCHPLNQASHPNDLIKANQLRESIGLHQQTLAEVRAAIVAAWETPSHGPFSKVPYYYSVQVSRARQFELQTEWQAEAKARK